VVSEIPEKIITSPPIASASTIPSLDEPLPTGFAQDLYMRARRLASASPIEDAPVGSVSIGRDDTARQVVVTLRLPFEIRDDFKAATSRFEIADYAE
jgi:hypothetical protein